MNDKQTREESGFKVQKLPTELCEQRQYEETFCFNQNWRKSFYEEEVGNRFYLN